MLKKAASMDPYVAIGVGTGVTVLVQSSSITTSVLTPLAASDIISLEQMLPLTLGANIGTTATGILAAMVSSKPESVQIAICHLTFNILGILLWYGPPVPCQSEGGRGGTCFCSILFYALPRHPSAQFDPPYPVSTILAPSHLSVAISDAHHRLSVLPVELRLLLARPVPVQEGEWQAATDEGRAPQLRAHARQDRT